MPKRVAILAFLCILTAAVAPLQADTVVQGSVRGIPTADNAAIAGTVGCRVYQVTGPVTTINANTPQCINIRCLRTFSTNAIFGGAGLGGYNCNQESTGTYGPPPTEPSNQTFYELVDAEANAGTCNHIAYYAVQGQSANNLETFNPGDARAANCAGTVAQNCFTAGDPTNSDLTPLLHTLGQFGANPHQIRSIGGLSPVPTVRVSPPGGGGCGPDEVRATWDDPIDATPLMKNGVPSPVQGVNLYMNPSPCSACPDGAIVQTPVPGTTWTQIGQFGASSGSTGTCVPIPAGTSAWFAITVRFKGPGNGPTTIETGLVGGLGFVGANSQCVDHTGTAARIVSFGARYVGRGTVNVRWTSGSEGGVQGFYVTRATSPSGPFTRISDLVSATGDSSRYVYTDHIRTSLGRTIVYQLEIARSDGTSERSGTTSVTVPGPKVKKLGAE